MHINMVNIIQGFGLGFVFVPLNTVAFATLPGELRTDATALWTLIRNIGSSIGISVVIAQLTSKTTQFHSQLVEHLTPINDALKMPDVKAVMDWTTVSGRALLDQLVTQQAAIMAYGNDFKLMMFISLAAFPLLLAIKGAKRPAGGAPEAHVMD
jgi:DHA2 family multidrug resistance protein